MLKIIEDELEIWAKERQLSRQMGAAAERDWEKREGYKYFTDPNKVIGEKEKNKISDRISKRMIGLFKGFNDKNSK